MNIECKDILDNLGDSQEMSPVNMDPKGISDPRNVKIPQKLCNVKLVPCLSS